MPLETTLDFKGIYKAVLKREDQSRGRPIGNVLYIGSFSFLNHPKKYVILKRVEKQWEDIIECYHFTKFSPEDGNKIMIRDARKVPQNKRERDYSNEILKFRGL